MEDDPFIWYQDGKEFELLEIWEAFVRALQTHFSVIAYNNISGLFIQQFLVFFLMCAWLKGWKSGRMKNSFIFFIFYFLIKHTLKYY